MNGHDQELQDLKKQIRIVLNRNESLEKPFFAKKVMRAVSAYEEDRTTDAAREKIYQLLRIALFMGLLLFPTLTEAII